MRNTILSLSAGALGSLLVLLLQQRLATRSEPPTLMTVDLQQLLTEQVNDVSRQKLSVDQQRAAATAYANALAAALDEVARVDHAVLLVTPAVLRGASDATAAVRDRLQQQLAAPSPANSTH